MGNVIHKGKGSFTHVENTIFFDYDLSAKAKGIYCQIRSLEGNPEWVFTIKGFASLVRDGVDAVTAGIKELEKAGYIIRARKRSSNGRFLKAEEATWITLDDPGMYAEVCDELKEDGFAILSEFDRAVMPKKENANKAENLDPFVSDDVSETGETGETHQLETRTGKSVSGKSTSGKSAPIKNLSNKEIDVNKTPLSCESISTDRLEEKRKEVFTAYQKGEFPEAFERLCSMSLKPVNSLKFKRDCLKAWQAKVEAGFEPEQINEAYEAYAKDYWYRNGDDKQLAKNLVRWIDCDDGLAAWSDEPIAPDIFKADGEPLDMPSLAEVDPGFAQLWRKVETRRTVIRSFIYGEGKRPPESVILEKCQEDDYYLRCFAACEKRYSRYLELFEFHQEMEKQKEALLEKVEDDGYPALSNKSS